MAAIGLAVAGTSLGLFAARAPRPVLPGSGSLLDAAELRSDAIVYTGPTGLRVAPLGGGPPGSVSIAPTGPAVWTASGVVFVHGGTAYLLAPPFTERPRALLPAADVFPMLWPGVIGVEWPASLDTEEAAFVDLQSGGPSDFPGWLFPAGYRPVNQLLASGPDGTLRPWRPVNGGAILGAPLGEALAVMTSSTPEVAWLSQRGCARDGECLLHVTQIDADGSGADRIVAPVPGHAGYLAGALSPDGEQLAAFVADPPGHPGHAQLVIIDTYRAEATLVPGGLVPVSGGNPTARWTPDGAFVLFCGTGGPMHLYRPGANRAVTLKEPGSSSFAIG